MELVTGEKLAEGGGKMLRVVGEVHELIEASERTLLSSLNTKLA